MEKRARRLELLSAAGNGGASASELPMLPIEHKTAIGGTKGAVLSRVAEKARMVTVCGQKFGYRQIGEQAGRRATDGLELHVRSCAEPNINKGSPTWQAAALEAVE